MSGSTESVGDDPTLRFETATEPTVVGEEMARDVVARYGTRDPWRIAEREALRIEREQWTGVGGVTLLGTYTDGVVTLYPRQIAAKAREDDTSQSALTDAVVAHELGHHLLTDIELPTSRSRWRRLFRFVTGSETGASRRFEERAAERFTTELLGRECPDSER